MQEQTIAQIKNLADGAVVGSFVAQIAEVQPKKKAGNGYVQGLKLQMGQDWIFADAWDHPDFTAHVGKTYVFHSVPKGEGFIGITVKEKPNASNPAKPYKNLSLSRSAKVQFVDVYQAQKPAVPAAPATNGDQPAPAPKGVIAQQVQSNKVDDTLGKLAALYVQCLIHGNDVAAEYHRMHGQPMKAEQFQAMVSALYIQATRIGLENSLTPLRHSIPAEATAVFDQSGGAGAPGQ